MNSTRESLFSSLRSKMEDAGFQFEKEQNPHFQKRKEQELKFVHPTLENRFKHQGQKMRAKKFYIKPLSDEPDCEIGLVTGKTSPLYQLENFPRANAVDTKGEVPAWSNRKNDPTLDKLLQSIKAYLDNDNMLESRRKQASVNKSFLFAWNPKKWDWVELQDCIDQLERLGHVERRWSCGNTKKINSGDRVFLVRLGKKPRGIMGSGYAKSSYYVAPHWDGSEGKTANYIDIEFDILINPESDRIFDEKYLNHIDSENKQQWFPQQSGISIKSEVIDTLESDWFNFIRKNKHIGNGFIFNEVKAQITKPFFEGKTKTTIQTRYERNPQARKVCLDIKGYDCQVCSFNFEKSFGDIGKEFIHVHHVNPIAQIGKEYEIDPEKDLMPVCPNCHAMIHSKRPAYKIEEIKEIRGRASVSTAKRSTI